MIRAMIGTVSSSSAVTCTPHHGLQLLRRAGGERRPVACATEVADGVRSVLRRVWRRVQTRMGWQSQRIAAQPPTTVVSRAVLHVSE